SLEGMVLRSLITAAALREDARIDAFSASHHAADELRRVLETEKAEYAGHLLRRLFSFSGLSADLGEWRQRTTATASLPDKEATITLQDRIARRVAEIEETAKKFRRQLRRLTEEAGGIANGLPVLTERCGKAIDYFTGRLALEILAPAREHIGSLRGKKKLKRYLAHVEPLERACWHKIEALYGAQLLDRSLYSGTPLHTRQGPERTAATIPATAASGRRMERGVSLRETLRLHCERKTPGEIATLRRLAVGTIKNHLARLIASGEIEVHEVLPADMIGTVMTFLEAHEDVSLTATRSGTGDHLDYNDLRMIAAHWSRIRAAAERKRP
ncbi:MAG TPA: helix-turn-helix domain-containing protein, partial [Steroidobacteraceae bacterium]|nr:helix-turn-helix domain-containing protein [Steroidobacteraceae bacterium]